MIGFREVEFVGDLLYRQVGEKKMVLDLLQEPALEQVSGSDAKFPLDRLVERYPADADHLRIVAHPVLVADILFQQEFVLIGIVVLGQREGQLKQMGVKAVQPQEELVKIGHDHVVAVRYWLKELVPHFSGELVEWGHLFRRHVETGGKLVLVAIEKPIHEIFVGQEIVDEFLLEDEKSIIEIVDCYMPLLLLVGRDDERHLVVQLDPFPTEKEMTGGLPEKVKLKEVGLVPLGRVEPTSFLPALRRIEQEIDAASGLGVFDQ